MLSGIDTNTKMEKLSEEEIISRKRTYMRNYMNEYNQTHDRTVYTSKSRMKPEYRAREILRMKNNRKFKKEYNIFKRAIPYYLTE